MSDDQQIPQEQSQDQTSQPAQSQEVAGVGLMIAAFTDEDAGDQVLKAMKQAKKQGQFDYEAAAIIKREADGDIHYHETGDMSTGKGAGIGALVGGVIGILGGPAGIALGAGAGAAIGAIAAHGDAGFRDSNLEEIGEALQPGSSAVMIITSNAAHDAVCSCHHRRCPGSRAGYAVGLCADRSGRGSAAPCL